MSYRQQMPSTPLSISFVGLLQVAAVAAAFQLGRMFATPKAKWEKGSLLQGGWAAWKVPLIVIVAVTTFMTIFLPLLTGPRGLLSGLGGRGGGFFGFGGARPGYGYAQSGYAQGYPSGYSSGYAGGYP